MEFKDIKKEICWFWNIELNINKTKYKVEPEEKVLALNAGENKRNNKNEKFLKGKCKKCGKYGKIVSYCWGNRSKGNFIRNKNNDRKPSFNG